MRITMLSMLPMVRSLNSARLKSKFFTRPVTHRNQAATCCSTKMERNTRCSPVILCLWAMSVVRICLTVWWARDELAVACCDSLNNKIKRYPIALRFIRPRSGIGLREKYWQRNFFNHWRAEEIQLCAAEHDAWTVHRKVTDGIQPRLNTSLKMPASTSKAMSQLITWFRRTINLYHFLNLRRLLPKEQWFWIHANPMILKRLYPWLTQHRPEWSICRLGRNLLDINQPLVLVTDEGKRREAVLRLARVGYENVVGCLKEAWAHGMESLTRWKLFLLSKRLKFPEVLMCSMFASQASEVSHLKSATFLPLSDILKNMATLAKNNPYLVHCAGDIVRWSQSRCWKRSALPAGWSISRAVSGAMVTSGLPVVTEEVVA